MRKIIHFVSAVVLVAAVSVGSISCADSGDGEEERPASIGAEKLENVGQAAVREEEPGETSDLSGIFSSGSSAPEQEDMPVDVSWEDFSADGASRCDATKLHFAFRNGEAVDLEVMYSPSIVEKVEYCDITSDGTEEILVYRYFANTATEYTLIDFFEVRDMAVKNISPAMDIEELSGEVWNTAIADISVDGYAHPVLKMESYGKEAGRAYVDRSYLVGYKDGGWQIIQMTGGITEVQAFDLFLNNQLPAFFSVDGGSCIYYEEYCNGGFLEEEEYKVTRLDIDNDGREELVIDSVGHYGAAVLDFRGGILYFLAQGEGTAGICDYTYIEDEAWIVHSDTTHADRQMFWFEKFNGDGKVADQFTLSAEYWEEPDQGKYTENSDFTYRDEKITMQEYEELRQLYMGW
ncbi:MAG: hypothetical protein NC121_05130 [Blautia sp.]|nr:hypothetical protein [Blautia sp.]